MGATVVINQTYKESALESPVAVIVQSNTLAVALNRFSKEKKPSPQIWLIDKKGKKKKEIGVDLGEPFVLKAMHSGKGSGWYLLGEVGPPKFENTLIHLTADGKVSERIAVRRTIDKNANSMISYKGGALLYGTHLKPDKSRDGWMVRVDYDGTIHWDRSFDLGKDETILSVIVKGEKVIFLSDSGKYNQYGQGESDLYVVEIDSSGNVERKIKISEGRANTKGAPLLIETQKGYLISYTKTQLPDIKKAQSMKGFAFDAWLASVSQAFKLNWTKKVGSTDGPGTSLLATNSDGNVYLSGAKKNGAWVAEVAVDGSLKWEAVGLVHGRYSVEGLVAEDSKVYVVGQLLKLPDVDDLKNGRSEVEQEVTLHMVKGD